MVVTARKAKIVVCSLEFLGILFLIIGIVALLILPLILKDKLRENLVLEEGKEMFEKWEVTPVPVYFSVYFFNCTNPTDVESFGAKPIMQEVGPFVYKQMRSKRIRSWEPENMTVTYDDIKTYYFVESMSADPEQMVYTLNMPMLGITTVIEKLNYFTRSFVSPTIDNMFESYGEKLFVKKPVRQLIFEGYKVDLVADIVSAIEPFYEVPNLLPNNSFAFLYGKNNSGDGTFSVFTGEGDLSKFTQISKWNNHSRLEIWKDEYCDMINGTDGSQFPPLVTKTDILYVYAAEFCRSLALEFQEEVYVKGILAYRFIIPSRLAASPNENPDNQCFCTKPNYCHWSGVLDIASCREGIPIGISGPHLYLAHPEIQDKIIGLNPSRELHESYVDVEPTTGVVLRASRKIQVNFLLEASDNFRIIENVTDAIIPLLWIKEAAEIDDNLASILKSKVKIPLTIANLVSIACIVLGFLWAGAGLFIIIYILIKKQTESWSKVKVSYKAVPVKPYDNDPKSEKQMPLCT